MNMSVNHAEFDGRSGAALYLAQTARDPNGAPIGGLAVAVRLLQLAVQRGERTMELREREPGTYLGESADVAAGAWDVEIDAARAPERLFRSRNRVIVE